MDIQHQTTQIMQGRTPFMADANDHALYADVRIAQLAYNFGGQLVCDAALLAHIQTELADVPVYWHGQAIGQCVEQRLDRQQQVWARLHIQDAAARVVLRRIKRSRGAIGVRVMGQWRAEQLTLRRITLDMGGRYA